MMGFFCSVFKLKDLFFFSYHNLHSNVSGLCINKTCRILNIQYNIAACFRTTHPVWHTCLECCPVSTTVCTNIIYLVWCQVSSLRYVLKSSLLFFCFLSFLSTVSYFPLYCKLLWGRKSCCSPANIPPCFDAFSPCTVSTLMRPPSELHPNLNPTVQRSCVFRRDEKDEFKWKQQDNHSGTVMTLQFSELRSRKSSREIL